MFMAKVRAREPGYIYISHWSGIFWAAPGQRPSRLRWSSWCSPQDGNSA